MPTAGLVSSRNDRSTRLAHRQPREPSWWGNGAPAVAPWTDRDRSSIHARGPARGPGRGPPFWRGPDERSVRLVAVAHRRWHPGPAHGAPVALARGGAARGAGAYQGGLS